MGLMDFDYNKYLITLIMVTLSSFQYCFLHICNYATDLYFKKRLLQSWIKICKKRLNNQLS
jgi:hypothetical protein